MIVCCFLEIEAFRAYFVHYWKIWLFENVQDRLRLFFGWGVPLSNEPHQKPNHCQNPKMNKSLKAINIEDVHHHDP